MRILITGGLGFIGGRVAQHLQSLGHEIVLGSRNASHPPDWLSQAKVVQTDWNDARALERICIGVDVVIQAAGINAQDCAADPVIALEFNGLATARLVGAASRTGVKRFIYLSTAHVYADPLIGVISEDTCPHNLHPYATSHLAGENAVLSASQRGLIEGVVLRLSNAFGTPAHEYVNCWMLLVNDLCRQAVQTHKMVLHSSGLQQRDFIAILEVCRVINYLSSCDLGAQLPNVFNVGSGISQSVREMARLVQRRCRLVLGFDPELQYPVVGAGNRPRRLTYGQQGLEKMGFTICVDNKGEIDSLLAFCHASFNQSRSLTT
ncbi:MAG: SDR family oxidoreductase [Cellvibrio sp.]|uniref:NAD-dependent epimerase/dehydratase family protein n=1 Tax=Cellvibrio sp. TaxID=1965322 RepID=UPI002725E36C|nr:SDR family oxidoreductase [Cellvibrio sp.]